MSYEPFESSYNVGPVFFWTLITSRDHGDFFHEKSRRPRHPAERPFAPLVTHPGRVTQKMTTGHGKKTCDPVQLYQL